MEELTKQLLTYKGLIVVLWLVALFLLERIYPAVKQVAVGDKTQSLWGKFLPIRVRRNVGLWLFNLLLSPLVIIPITTWASLYALDWRPDILSGSYGILLDIVVLDGLIYWWHRMNHEIPFLWRFHEIHHLDDTLDTTSAIRFHFGEVLLSAVARSLVVILLDISVISIICFEILLLVSTIFHHSNLVISTKLEGYLSKFIITPEIHWIHHHAIREDTDSNYGTIFSWWDKFFGSKSLSRRRLDMRIGVEGMRDKSFPTLLIRPFKKRP